MAATQPYSTYTTKRFSFVGNPAQRTGSSIAKDQIFINFFASEKKGVEGPQFYLEQRAGLIQMTTLPAGEGRGIYYWNGSVFAVIGSNLYRNNVAIQTLSTSTGSVGFQEFANETNQSFLVVLDGISGWVLNQANVITKITSPNFPTPHVVHAAYLDGYLVVAKAGTADLYNSNLLDPMTWTAGDFISAETFPDTIVALCRQNNYIVAIGQQTTEFFYNAGNAPGTPLERNNAALHQFGTPAPDSMAQTEEQVIYVGQTLTGGRTMWVLNGSTPAEISTEQVRQSLDNEGVNIKNAKGFCIRSKGHKFYVLNLTNVTWVYDFDSKMWHQWADYTGTTRFGCDYANDYSTGSPLMLGRSNGYVALLSDSASADFGNNITSIAVSDRIDFGNMNNKFMHRFSLACDIPNIGNDTSCTLYWSDNDYKTYTAGRVIPIQDTMPTTTQLGMFRRRAFKLVYSGSSPMRLDGFEVDINVGSQ